MKITNIMYHNSTLTATIFFDEIDRTKLFAMETDAILKAYATERNHRISRFRGLSVYSGNTCVYAVDVPDRVMEVQRGHAEEAAHYVELIFGEHLVKLVAEFKNRKQSDSNS